GPQHPIELSISAPIIERKAVSVLLRQIKCDLRSSDFLRKQFEPEHAIPDQVIFLAPAAWLIEREAVMIAILRHGDPPLSKLLRQSTVLCGRFDSTGHLSEHSVGAQRENRLNGQIRVVRQMPGEVVG